eukprot:GCRY01002233.1.p1 GENE.GCRY01002233.1~~GCRY01002233.1.p1  ORF type:complete len:512 (-),score=116.93 GCRY01002233.1:111-1646(-)
MQAESKKEDYSSSQPQASFTESRSSHAPPSYQDSGIGHYEDQQALLHESHDFSNYKDLWAAAAFLVHFILGYLCLWCLGEKESFDEQDAKAQEEQHSSVSGSDSDDINLDLTKDEQKRVMQIASVLCFFALFYSFCWLVIARKFAKQLIWFTLVAGVFVTGILFFLFLSFGNVYMSIFMLVMFGLNLLFVYFWRSRIPFATVMLQTCSRLVSKYPATVVVQYLALAVEIVFIVFWAFSLREANRFYSETSRHIWIAFLVFSFYWTCQVINTVVHTTSCGVFGTWYFLVNPNAIAPSNPTLKSLKRATTWSFGSVCFGSLLIAIVRCVRALASYARQMARERGHAVLMIFALCILCIVRCFEDLLEYFNTYAFVQVAVYGKPFMQAARDTWTLAKERGVDALINDNLIGGVILLGAIIGGLVTAFLGFVLSHNHLPSVWVFIMTFVGLFIGLVFTLLTMAVLNSAVATIFVCFAENPECLAQNQPETYTLFVETYRGRGLNIPGVGVGASAL